MPRADAPDPSEQRWYRVYGTEVATRRVTLDIAADDHKALRRASVEEDIPMTDLIRAMIVLWRSDPSLREQVDALVAGEGDASRH